MKREALVVGINRYPTLIEKPTDKPPHLKAPAADAEAIAQILESYGDFHVQRLPVHSQDGVWRVDSHQPVTLKDLKEAIVQLFNPSKLSIPDTALLFFAGHGLRDNQGGVPECFLATSDCCTPIGQWGLSLDWLRKLLQSSPVRQQIVWLDCCYSGGLLNFDEADPGNIGKALDRCLISACRDFEVGYEQLQGEHGILTAALLQSLDPERHVDGWVTNYKLAADINKQMYKEPQRPVFHNSGGAIILTDKTNGERQQIDPELVGKCPYKSLSYFTQEDAVFFYGRTKLTDKLINKVRTENFIAVLGASGSGKSSVLRAGLLYQLKRGQKLSGSDRWKYYDPFTPGEHPFESLQNAIGGSLLDLSLESEVERWVEQLTQLIASLEHERVVLVVDQFEECFTMCQDNQERERFFACLLGAVEQSKNKLCLVLGMRADFLGRCAEYGELAHKIDQHLVTVKPMTRTEIEEAITKPAELVGLQVEKALVTKMTGDVVGSPGSLPLLQYTLTELWNQAQTGANRDRLQLNSYEVLGGIEATLPKRANEVYQNLPPEQQPVAKRIFLELTQIGEISDSRRRVFLEDLINQQHSWQLLSEVKDRLVAARLITADAISIKDAANSQQQEQKVLLDIVHESLIRHWQELRQWVEKHQVALEIERRIEARARGWSSNGKIDDPGLLLKGATLTEAEVFLQEYGDLGLLDGVAEEYIKFSQDVREREEKDKEKQIAELKRALNESKLREQSARVLNLLPVQPREALALAIQTMGLNLDQLPKEALSSVKNLAKHPGKILGVVQASLHEAMTKARVPNIFRGHESSVNSVAISLDGKMIVSGSADNTLRLWDICGNPIGHPMRGHEGSVNSVAISPDGKMIVSGSADNTQRLWDICGNPIGLLLLGHEDSVNSVAISPDGKMIVSGSADKTLRLWDINGNSIGLPLLGHEDSVNSVAISPDGKMIVSGSADKTLRLWDINGSSIGQPLHGHEDSVTSVAFNPDGQKIISSSYDYTVRLWNIQGSSIGQPFKGHESAVTSVAFSSDGQRIVSGSWDKTVRLWNLQGKVISKLFWGSYFPIRSVTFSPDAQTIISGSDDKTVRLWDLQSNLIGQLFQAQDCSINSVAFSPDGQTIVSGSSDKTIQLCNVQGNSISKLFQGHENNITSVAFSPDGQTIVSGSWDGTVRLWDRQGNLIGEPFRGHNNSVWSVAFSPNGQIIVSGSRDGTIRLWDKQGNPINRPFQWLEESIRSVAFSPDGQSIASGSRDGIVQLWDLEGNLVCQLFRGHNSSVFSVAFSPDGQTLVSGGQDGTVRLWNLQGNPIGQPFQAHQYSVRSVVFSPDGQCIVSGGEDRIVRFWDLQGNPIGQPFQAHRRTVSSVAFNPYGQTIVSGSDDGTLRLWRGSWKAWLKVCCDRLAYHLISENPEIDIIQGTCIACVKHKIWSGTDLGKILMRQGNDLARQEKLEKAIAKFQQAKEYDPSLDLNPEAEARRLAVPTLVSQGEMLARQMKLAEAIAKFQQAKEYDPSLDLNPEAEARQRAAPTLVNQGEMLARQMKLEEAIAKFQQAKEYDPNLGLNPKAEAQQLAAPTLVNQAKYLAEQMNLEEAITKFQQAKEYDPSLDLNPEAEARQLAALSLVNQAKYLAEQMKLEEAIAKFQQALEYDPSLDLNPQAEARRLAAPSLVEKGRGLVREGKVEDTITAYIQAQTFDPTLEISAESWNSLCWFGSLHGQAANPKVMAACEKAVELEPEDGNWRDSRGLTRALTGNIEGAIEDFQAFIASTDNEEWKLQRQRWIDALLARENPFTPEEIETLFNQ